MKILKKETKTIFLVELKKHKVRLDFRSGKLFSWDWTKFIDDKEELLEAEAELYKVVKKLKKEL